MIHKYSRLNKKKPTTVSLVELIPVPNSAIHMHSLVPCWINNQITK